MKTVIYSSEVLDREFTYEIPFKIVCNVSGLTKTYTLESYINRKIDRFGGLEKLLSKYVCKDANRLLKQDLTPQQVKEKLNPTPTEEVLPVEEVIELQVEETIQELPLAKKDKNGRYRNLKGQIIQKEKLMEYALMD